MRTQFYDPFGMRTQGYRAGVADEMQVQDQTRRADQFDWERANMRPILLQAAQREEEFMGATDPWRRNLVRGADYDAEIGRRLNYGLRSGNTAPAMVYDFSQFAPNAQYYLPEVIFLRNEQDGSMGWNLPGGGFAPFQQNPQNYLDYAQFNNPAILQSQQFNAAMLNNNNQFDATLQQNAMQQANSLAWLQWQQGRGNTRDQFGLEQLGITPGWAGNWNPVQ